MKSRLLTFVITMFYMVLASQNVAAVDMSHCISMKDVWGKNCNSSRSLQVKVTNNCGRDIYVDVCIENVSGRWQCGVDSSLSPNRTASGFWSCNATGRVKVGACTGGRKECGLDL